MPAEELIPEPSGRDRDLLLQLSTVEYRRMLYGDWSAERQAEPKPLPKEPVEPIVPPSYLQEREPVTPESFERMRNRLFHTKGWE